MSSKVKPDISHLIEELEDDNLKEIFRRFVDFHETQNQLQDFQHIIITTDSAQANLKVRHNLSFVPKDIIKTKKTGSGNITFNYASFDKEFLDVTTTDSVNWRGFVGTYFNDNSNQPSESTETF